MRIDAKIPASVYGTSTTKTLKHHACYIEAELDFKEVEKVSTAMQIRIDEKTFALFESDGKLYKKSIHINDLCETPSLSKQYRNKCEKFFRDTFSSINKIISHNDRRQIAPDSLRKAVQIAEYSNYELENIDSIDFRPYDQSFKSDIVGRLQKKIDEMIVYDGQLYKPAHEVFIAITEKKYNQYYTKSEPPEINLRKKPEINILNDRYSTGKNVLFLNICDLNRLHELSDLYFRDETYKSIKDRMFIKNFNAPSLFKTSTLQINSLAVLHDLKSLLIGSITKPEELNSMKDTFFELIPQIRNILGDVSNIDVEKANNVFEKAISYLNHEKNYIPNKDEMIQRIEKIIKLANSEPVMMTNLIAGI